MKKKIEEVLRRVNNVSGKGTVLAVVWGKQFAGIDQSRHGVVVRQMQYGMDAKRFTLPSESDTEVRFLGRVHKVPSKLPLMSR